MSETLKPETEAMVEELSHDEDSYYERMIKFADSMEADRNRWRSVAEQAEKALEMTQFGALGKRRCPVCAGWNVGPHGETDKVHTKDCPVSLALSAFDSLRKEQGND